MADVLSLPAVEVYREMSAEPVVPNLDPPVASETDRLEELAVRHGRNYDAYLVTEPGWEYFW